MRAFEWTSIGLVVLGSIAVAQQPPGQNPTGGPVPIVPGAVPAAPTVPPVTLDPKNPLDALLIQWEQKMKSVTSLAAEVSRTETDPVDKKPVVYSGVAKLMRPDRAMLYLQKQTNPQVYEHYVFTGKFLYEVRPQTKTMKIHALAPPKPGQVVDDNFLGFLFGMKAEDAKRRYSIALHKEDQYYYYLMIEPKLTEDRAEFTKARLALFKGTWLPRQLEFELGNQSTVKWDIPRIDTSAAVNVNDFREPQVPRDWQVIQVPQQQLRSAPPPANQPGIIPAPGSSTPPPTKVRPAGGS